MLRINRLFSIVLLVSLILSACQPIQPLAKLLAPEPVGLRPDAPEYAKHGPFWVGYKALVIGEGTDHPLAAGLWYPALNPQGVKEEMIYTITTKIPVEGMKATAPIYGRALLAAEIDASAGPYPLVVFSHGFGANAAWFCTFVEHLVSHGFIVLAPEHMETWDPEWSEIPNASIDRPRDIKLTLDYAEQASAPGGELAGLLDMDNVAVAGHSYGGYTALAMAGAQYDLDAFNARCAALAPDDPNQFLCAPILPREEEMAARAGLASMPEGLWPSFGDPRVKVILPMAGDSYLFDKAGLAKITIPMMAIGGTADTGTPYEWGSKPAYDYASSEKKALVTLLGAEHAIIASCDTMPWMAETPFNLWICYDPVWDKARGQDLINHFATAFLLAELKGDDEAAKALAPENVTFPGIQYETTGFGSEATTAPVAPTEVLVTDISDLVGTWQGKFEGYTIYLAFKADGQYTLLYDITYMEDSGEFVLVDGKFRFATATGHCSANPVASYVVQFEEGESAATYLRFTPVGQDFCAERQTMLTDAPLKFVSK